jgi:iron complex transport system substrate-binding protein
MPGTHKRGDVYRTRHGLTPLLICMTVVAAVLFTALESGASATVRADSSPRPAGYPVTVMSCGQSVTFDAPPKRAVSNDINLTEDMLALGLAPRMVGAFGVGDPMPAPYKAAFNRVRHVSSGYFKLEPLVGLHPDFLFAGWNYGLTDGSNLTPANLAKFGIKTYVLQESCAHVQPDKQSVSIDDTYTDLRNLGIIFGVRNRAEALIAKMQATIAGVQHRVANTPATPVFLYDSGEASPFTAPGLALPNDLITRAGGTNVFSDLKQTWTAVSWEQVVARRPACILINDYSTPTAAQKRRFLDQSANTKDLPAIRNHCLLALTYDELTPGPRNADAIVAMARWLHPQAFTSLR